MRRGSLFWGILLVLIGAILLSQTMGLIPPGVNIWSIFWALVLVGLGVWILFPAVRGGSRLHEEPYRLPLDDARSATLRIRHGAGELRIDAHAAPGDLLSGTFVGGVQPTVNHSADGVTVELRSPVENYRFMTGFEGRSGALNWTIGLDQNTPFVLDLEVGACRNLINLRDLQVKELRLQTGASASEIDFPTRAGETRAWLKSGMASVVARVPEGVSARIRVRGGLSSVTVDTARFPLVSGGSAGIAVSGEYCSPDYAVAANRLDLDIESGVGSTQVC
jgi:hypothetical protein